MPKSCLAARRFSADADACADYDSVIGMDKAEPLQRFLHRKMSTQRFAPATGPATLCGVFVQTGAKGCDPHRAGAPGWTAETVAAGALSRHRVDGEIGTVGFAVQGRGHAHAPSRRCAPPSGSAPP